jgi:hypothetical protein
MSTATLNATSRRAPAAALAAGLVLLGGCASTRLDAQWTDPQFAGRSLRGVKVLVVCDAPEVVVQRICVEQVAAQVASSGATPVMGPDVVPPAPGQLPASDQYLSAARAAGAQAVLSSSVAPDASVVNPGPLISFGIGGFGGGYRGGGVGGGVGVTAPAGSAQVTTGYAANSTLTDVGSGRLMWSAKATTPASQDVNTQVTELAKSVVGAAKQAGLF